MALTIITEQPITTALIGSGWTVTGGGGVASTALSDGSDATFVTNTSRATLDSQILGLGFAVPSIPSGAQVYSVGVRVRYQQLPAGSNQPSCVHWYRSTLPATSGSTVTATTVAKSTAFYSLAPISLTATTAFETDSIATFFTAPDGTGWNPATNLANFTYDMGRNDDYGNALVISEVFLDITYQQQAVVTVTGPTGTVQGSRQPVTWTYAQGDSQPQQAFQVAIYSQAQTTALGFVAFQTVPLQGTNGFVLSDASAWIPPYDLVDGTYVAYCQTKSKWGGLGDFLSPIASGTFTRSASSGGAGTFPPNALATAVFDTVNNRVGITMTPSSSGTVTKYFTVFSSYNNGVSWAPVPSLTLVTGNGMTPVTQYDYVAPLSTTAQYQVLAFGPSATTPVAAAAFSSVQSVTTSGITVPWLKDPQNNLNNTPISMFAKGNKSARRRVQGTFEPLSGSGNVFPVVVNGPVYGESGTIVLFYTWDQVALYEAWTQLDTSGHVLLFQRTDGTQLWVTLGPGAAGQDTAWEYESIDPSGDLYEKITYNFSQVSAPSYY